MDNLIFNKVKFANRLISFRESLRKKVDSRDGLRKVEKKVAQNDIAKELGIDRKTYRSWEEAGNSRLPYPDELVHLGNKYHCSIEYLLGLSECITPNGEYISDQLHLSPKALEFFERCTDQTYRTFRDFYYAQEHPEKNRTLPSYIPKLLSDMIEIAPDNFISLFAAIQGYFKLHSSPFEEVELYRLGVEHNCGQELTNLLRSMLANNPRYREEKEQALNEMDKHEEELQKKYDNMNPHKKYDQIYKRIGIDREKEVVINKKLLNFFMEIIKANPELQKKYTEFLLSDSKPTAKDSPEA